MDIKEFMKDKMIENIRIDPQSIPKERIMVLNLLNQAILQLQGIAYYTRCFMLSFLDKIAPIVIPKKWGKVKRDITDVANKIGKFLEVDNYFWRPVALIDNLLESIIKVIEKAESVFGEDNIVTNYLQVYKAFTEIAVRNLVILLYHAGADKLFSEASKFVNEEVMKHFKLDNDPENLLEIFLDLTAILTHLSEDVARAGWETFKEEAFKYGGYIEGEEPTD